MSAELERGIPLKAGDSLYFVQQHFPQPDAVDGAWLLTNESIVYKPNCRECAIDAWQFIQEQGLKEYKCKHCPYQVGQDSGGNSFEYIRNFDVPDWGYYFDRQLAKVKAEELFIEAFSKLPCHITEVFPKNTPKQFDLDAWLEANEIELKISDRNWKPLHFNQQICIEKAQRDGFDRQYSYHVLSFLHAQKRFDLLPDLWQKLGYAPLATINTFVVEHDCYLQGHTL